MANKNGTKENLIPMSERTEEERREISSRGGKARAEAEKHRKQVAETFKSILNLEYEEPWIIELDRVYNGYPLSDSQFRVNLEGHTLLTGLCCEIVRQAIKKGDLKACKIILDYIEPTTNRERTERNASDESQK